MEICDSEKNRAKSKNSEYPELLRVQVAIPDSGSGPGVYTYSSPHAIGPGTRVQVSFGSRQVVGIVVRDQGSCAHGGEKKSFKIKGIEKILDPIPLFDRDLLALAEWLARYYMCPIGLVFQAMLPLGVVKKTTEMIELSPKGYLKVHSRCDPEYSFLYGLFRDPCLESLPQSGLEENSDDRLDAKGQGGPPDGELLNAPETVRRFLPTLSRALLARRLKKHLSDRRDQPDAFCWHLFPEARESFQKGDLPWSSLQKPLITALSRRGLIRRTKTKQQVVRQEVRLREQEKSRDLDPPIRPKPTLTPAQREVVREVLVHGFGITDETGSRSPGILKPTQEVFLLHGITGSGKTEVYLQLIEALLRDSASDKMDDEKVETVNRNDGAWEHEPDRSGRETKTRDLPQILVMVPEISLTPQMTYLFESRFPGMTAVVHSAMGDAKRWQELENIAQGKAQILIGPRSAVLSRFRNLALIIVDEEHDQSYKQENGLRYHARDVAVVRSQIGKFPVLLGSATPSLETYQNALDGRYRLCRMMERTAGSRLPDMEVLVKRAGSHALIEAGGQGGGAREIQVEEMALHPTIASSIEEVLARQEQVIVLVNRRGYSHYLRAQSSGLVVQCSQCSISFTFHKKKGLLQCHYCDEKKSLKALLEERPGETYVAVGDGSQKAEESLLQMFPHARIARVDSDTMTGASIGKTIELFRNKSLDILVGTQMLAKGHDFPDVTLVVLLNVDRALHFPDFRAGERTFQLLVQASGRAGRGGRPGRVLLQLDRSDHPVIQAAMKHDYLGFSAFELAQRRAILYPPFSRMMSFCFTSENQGFLEQTMVQVSEQLEKLLAMRPEFSKIRVLGPAVPGLEKIRDIYRQMMILTTPVAEVKVLRQLGDRLVQAFKKLPRGIDCKVDVDPQNLM